MIRRKQDMRVEPRHNIRGGDGVIDTLHFLEKEDTLDKIKLCSVMTILPGCSMGEHPHDAPEGEIYYILEGQLWASYNGEETILHKGDAMYTTNSDKHAVRNVTNEPCTLLAIVIN